MRLLAPTTLLLSLVACVPPAGPPPALTPAPVAPIEPSACPAWDACTRVAGPLDVSGDEPAYDPEVVWTGDALLVLHRHPLRPELRAPLAHEIVVVGLDGRVMWRERLVGSAWAKVAWNRSKGAGLVVSDVGLSWLGRDGRALRSVTPLPRNVKDAEAIAARDGFEVLATTGGGPIAGHADDTPSAVTWRSVSGSGDRVAALRGGPALAIWRAGVVELFSMAERGVFREPTRAALPERAQLLALFADGHTSFAIIGEGHLHDLSLARLDASGSAARRLGARSATADVVRIGDAWVLGGDEIGGERSAAAALDRSGALGSPRRIGGPGASGLRLTATPRGFGAVWVAGERGRSVTRVAVYDCCPR